MKKNSIFKILIAFIFAFVLSTNIYGAEIKGDLDGDGEVTAYDAYLSLLVAQEDEDAIEVTEDNIELIDIDSNKEITEEDVKLILDYSVDIVEDPTMWIIEEVKPEEEPINRFYYNQLDEYGKIIYDSIMNDIDYIEKPNNVAFINLGNSMDNLIYGNEDRTFVEEIREVQYAIEYDNPEKFYMGRFAITNDSGLEPGQMKMYTSDGYKIISGVRIYKTAQTKNVDLTEYFEKMENVKNNVVNSVTGLSDYDKYLTIHDYIIDNTAYVKDSVNEQNSYGCLIDKKAVCNGYAKAYKYLCNSVGLKCEIIVSETHAWNAVYLDDAWYYVDTTWDDTQSSKYKYFLRGLNYFASDTSHKQYKLSNLLYPNISRTDYKK